MRNHLYFSTIKRQVGEILIINIREKVTSREDFDKSLIRNIWQASVVIGARKKEACFFDDYRCEHCC